MIRPPGKGGGAKKTQIWRPTHILLGAPMGGATYTPLPAMRSWDARKTLNTVCVLSAVVLLNSCDVTNVDLNCPNLWIIFTFICEINTNIYNHCKLLFLHYWQVMALQEASFFLSYSAHFPCFQFFFPFSKILNTSLVVSVGQLLLRFTLNHHTLFQGGLEEGNGPSHILFAITDRNEAALPRASLLL